MDAIFTRRSIRKFLDQPIEVEKINKILRAGMQAPSAKNQQPWEFFVVQKPENLKKLAETSPFTKPILTAPVAIVLLANDHHIKLSDYWHQDMGACAQNVLLEATELGLGSLWMGIAPEPERMKYIVDLFKLPDNLKPFCIIALGYPDEQTNHFVDRYDSARIHHD